MRRLLLAAAVLAALPLAPATAGPAACVVANGFPACAGTCSAGDPLTVVGISRTGAQDVEASCGGGTASCTTFRAACSGSGQASGPGVLSCGGGAAVVICTAGITASTR